MPQATDELRSKFPGMDAEAIKVLQDAGYQMTMRWTWIKPDGHEPIERELDALRYLVDEWDWGGLED